MVRQWQEMFWDNRYSAVDLGESPDFVKLAEAYGCVGVRVDETSQMEDALRLAEETRNVPVVIDFRVSREENVFPMIPSGKTYHDLILNAERKGRVGSGPAKSRGLP